MGNYNTKFKYTVCILHYACIVHLFLQPHCMVDTARHIITLASCESPPLPTVTWQHPTTTRQHQLSNSASRLYPS